MLDALFTSEGLSGERIYDFAEDLGLDMERFRHELDEGLHADKVQEDFRSGVNGTPTFFVNGQRYDGPWDTDGHLFLRRGPGDQARGPLRRAGQEQRLLAQQRLATAGQLATAIAFSYGS